MLKVLKDNLKGLVSETGDRNEKAMGVLVLIMPVMLYRHLGLWAGASCLALGILYLSTEKGSKKRKLVDTILAAYGFLILVFLLLPKACGVPA